MLSGVSVGIITNRDTKASKTSEHGRRSTCNHHLVRIVTGGGTAGRMLAYSSIGANKAIRMSRRSWHISSISMSWTWMDHLPLLRALMDGRMDIIWDSDDNNE